MSLFGFGDDNDAQTDETSSDQEDENEDVPDELQSITGERYQIDPQDHIREGGTYVGTKTPSESPESEYDIVASDRIRRDLEDAYDDPHSPLWTGYDVSAQQGFAVPGIPFEDLFQHLWLVGTTGAGKTTQLLNQMVQLAYGGHGFVYFDPKAEDSRELLRMLPEHRLDDVVWIEPGSDEFEKSVAINFLDVPECDSEAERERAIEDRLEVLKAIFDNDEYWGINMASITESMGRAMLKHNAEADDPEDYYSIIDFYFVLLLEQRREAFAEEVDDPFVAEFVSEIADMDDDDVRPLLKRIKSWVENGIIRRIAACRESTIDFQKIIDDNKIVIVRTPVSNDDIKQMISLGTMRPIWTAVQNKSFDGEREPFFAIFDEADKVLNENLDVADMLARARSMKLSVTLACQYPTQLAEAGVLKAVQNNCNNLQAFRVNDDDDARPLMKRFRGYEVEDLLETENYHIWTRVPLEGGGRSDPLKLSTFPPYPPLRSEEEADEVIRESLDRYGRTPLTDEEIRRNLHFGEFEEAFDTGVGDDLDLSDDDQRNQALKAVYDETIRHGDPGGWIEVAECVDRLNRYLPGDDVTDAGKAWRKVLQEVPDPYIDRREVDDEMQVKPLDTGFLNLGDSENDGKAEHWAPMADAYVPMTQLEFIFEIPEQTGDAMPDGLARLDDVLDINRGDAPDAVADAVNAYREDHPLLDRLAGTSDAYIESEHTTGSTQPSQTVKNLAQAHNAGHRCLFFAREDVAESVYETVADAPFCCRSSHPDDDERRFYTGTTTLTIDGETITRPGDRENVWVYDEQTGKYELRDGDGAVHARFNSAADIFTDTSAYPSGGDRNVKPPIIPEYEMDGDLDEVEWDVIVVPPETETPMDMRLYEGDKQTPLTDLPTNDESEVTEEETVDMPREDEEQREKNKVEFSRF
ncbi:type IV secretory system conjugative DNA transfer family protein [Halomicrococcus sp. NG-SE-24]|uniref:type IV secretory system conjugative DNA transfer family protein n=1 Tax=Halomicrococcus sp. NG-SE-24 TaxID=3436928 RepID=UPI003D9859EC